MDYKTYLAANVLNEHKNVSYRLLSRELKVSVNVAKRMLYNFHSVQNDGRPNSVFAFYLVDGFLNTVDNAPESENNPGSGEETAMQSSPFMSSPAMLQDEPVLIIPVRHVTLCGQDLLKDTVSRYQTIESIHIYSLSSAPLKNIEVLSDCNRVVAKDFIKEDPLSQWKTYGVIQNPAVKRRTGPRPANLVQGAATTDAHPKSDPNVVGGKTSAEIRNVKVDSSSSVPSRADLSSQGRQPTEKTVTKQPSLRRDASDISKAFAKSKPKGDLKETTRDVKHSASNGEDQDNDAPMKSDSEDGDSEDFASTTKAEVAIKGPSRSERQEALLQMMEDDEGDEEMPDVASAGPASLGSPEEVLNDQTPAKEANRPVEPEATGGGGRRRGRRKVMRKKTIKDDEGYLVTKEEPAWESFSEEESPSSKPKPSVSSAASNQVKKGSGKPGQGNITSFFGKR